MIKHVQIILFSTSILILFNCNNKKDNTSQNELQQNLRIILTDPVETLDPMKIIYRSDWEVASNIYEGLVSLDENSNLVYELVDTITISNDKKEYTFFSKREHLLSR